MVPGNLPSQVEILFMGQTYYQSTEARTAIVYNARVLKNLKVFHMRLSDRLKLELGAHATVLVTLTIAVATYHSM